MPYTGRYCPGNGTAIPRLLPLQCRYICLQSPTCKAYNYNTTETLCTYLISPCPLAFSDTAMEFSVFTGKSIDQCYHWVSKSSENDPRMISTDNPERWICRMQRDDSDIMCHFTRCLRGVMLTGKTHLSTVHKAIPVSACALWRAVPSFGFLTSPEILYTPALSSEATRCTEMWYLWLNLATTNLL